MKQRCGKALKQSSSGIYNNWLRVTADESGVVQQIMSTGKSNGEHQSAAMALRQEDTATPWEKAVLLASVAPAGGPGMLPVPAGDNNRNAERREFARVIKERQAVTTKEDRSVRNGGTWWSDAD